ncbi:MAG: sugar ABC transporter permease, partial [Ignavibacteriae bacterium]|nr:sugar ABC transporter permease [Ignavibacteriota bacterium]
MNSKKSLRLFFTYLTLIVFCVIAVYPIMQVVTISLRPSDRLLSTSLEIIPDNATFRNYIDLFNDQPFILWMWNSLFVSMAVTITGVVLAAMTGYAFSRFRFIGKKIGLLSLLTTQMFPATMLLLP